MMTTTRRLMVGLIFLSSIGNVSVGLAAKDDGRARGPKLEFADAKRKHGPDAIKAIGNRLSEVAQYHGMSTERLKAMLERDSDLWVTDDSELLFICEGLKCDDHDHAEAADSEPVVSVDDDSSFDAPYPLAQTFLLHSRPGADKTVFLDFDGHRVDNTPWENGGDLQVGGYYTDINAASSLTQIQQIWAAVAEDYAPFDVDVTTEDPGSEDLRKYGTGDTKWGIRAAFTRNLNLLTGNAIINAAGGGTAYYNSFNWSTDDIALIFNTGLYTGSQTASHETGHTLGLSHDGYPANEYYPGHGSGATSWAPIMGASWLGTDEKVVQYSKGEYFSANNTQDDLAVITTGNGFGYRADDHGDTSNNASPLALTGTVFTARGVIEQQTDVDVFSFTVGGGSATIDVTPYNAAPNLDILARLYDSAGSLVEESNPESVLTAAMTVPLAAGTYYLHVEGTGCGAPLADPPTGYTSYASLGQYEVSVSATNVSICVLTAPADGATFIAPATIQLEATASLLGEAVVRVEFFNDATKLGEDSTSPYACTWTNVAAGSYTLTAMAIGDGGATNTSVAAAITVTVDGSGLVAHWKLDETNGPTALDSSGMENSGTLVNGPAWTPGIVGGALSFDGVDDLMTAAHSASLSLTRFTVGGWVKLMATKSDWQPIITKEASDGGHRNYGLFVKPNELLMHFAFLAADGSTWRSYDSVGELPLDDWAHVMMTYDGTNFTLYMNGAVDRTVALVSTVYQNSEPVKLGGETAAFAKFNGMLDDMRIYNRAISAPEVAALAAGGGSQPLTCALTAPTNGATYTAPASITLAADASSATGTIAKVEFFTGTTKLGESTNSPYACTWTNVAVGAYTLTAQATDNVGAMTTSTAVNVTVTLATYTVAYNANGATGGTVPTSQTKTNGVALTLATNIGNLVRPGYIFTGWNTAADGGGTDYAEGASYTVEAAATLYATWQDNGIAQELPFVEGFEINTVALGDLNGQNNWTVSAAGAAMVQTDEKYAGDRALKLAAPSTVTVSQALTTTASVVWLDLMQKVAAGPVNAPQPAAAAAFLFDADGRLVVWDGAQAEGSEWVTLTNHTPRVAGTWARVTARADYALQTWSLYLDGTNVAENLGFAAPQTRPTRLLVEGSGAVLDDLYVGLARPAGFPGAGNIVPDEWYLSYFGEIREDAADSDGDGMINLHEYLANTIPTDPLSVLRITESEIHNPQSEIVIRWQSEDGKVYSLRAATNLVIGFDSTLATGIEATPPLNTHTDSVDGVGSKFYRVLLEE